jgi:hypothetical protein
VKAFHALTDEELVACDWNAVVESYKALRAHHVAETEMLTKKDRSAILRMAGNIASGLVQYGIANNTGDLWEKVARDAVELARAILTELDR